MGKQRFVFQTEWNRAVKASLSCLHAEALFFIGGKIDWSGERMGGSMCFLKC
ncbi:hypothetical protein D2M30_0127 [Bacillus amyloliquefaciens]|nr:hypothetical protein D2M30_0127 [Bacillus amyloliquefaciens]